MTTKPIKTTIELLEPIVQMEKIPKDKFNTLPMSVQMLAHNATYVSKATVTPRRVPGKEICRVKMVTPDSYKKGNLIIENGRRVPIEDPAPDKDDLRPIIFYGIGTGTLMTKVTLQSDTNNCVYATMKFE